MKADPIGTVRLLSDFEDKYFEFMSNHYRDIPTTRKSDHYFIRPPNTWKRRFDHFRPPGDSFYEDIDLLSNFATHCCPLAERNNWRKVLDPLKKGSMERFLWSLLFLKSTNGVADKVSCGHFSKVVRSKPHISLDLCENPKLIASIMRQTSKWVKIQ